MWIEIAITALLLVYVFWNQLFGSRPKGYPPGPSLRFPIVGNLPQFGKDPFGSLSGWKKKYGNVVGLRFGDFNMVLLSGYDTIKEAFDKPEFSGRPDLGPFVLIAGKHKRGIVAAEGQQWSEQRRFALRHLRDFGFGKKSMEGCIQDDATDLINGFLKDAGKSISTNRRLQMIVLNSLWNIIAGEKFAQNDPRFQSVLDQLQAAFSSSSISGPVFFMPWVAKLIPNQCGWSEFVKAIQKAKALIGGVIKEHKETLDLENHRDFMDVYLNEVKNTTDQSSSFYMESGEENMLISILNLFGAGAETTSNTLNWSFYFLAQNQEIQKKFRNEIEAVVGRSRLPSFDDKEKMIYTEAVMLEVFRRSSIVPFGVFHKTTQDVEFQGYTIPEGTSVMANIYEVHHDEDVWGDPENFRPERFLSPDGKSLVKVGNVIPFSIGKRVCLGSTLATNEFFLFLTSVIQRFEITFDSENLPNDSNQRPSIFRFPPNFQCFFKDLYTT